MPERSHPLGNLIRELREERGWRQVDLAEKLGIVHSAIVRREKGLTVPKIPERKRLAELFGLTFDEFEAKWREHGRPPARSRGGDGIPLIAAIGAGHVRQFFEYGTDSGQGWQYVDRGDIHDDQAYAVLVDGDSMAPLIMDGDIVIFTPMSIPRPRAELTPGTIVHVTMSEDCSMDGQTLAAWFPEGEKGVRLQKANPRYAPIICERTHIRQLGVLVELRRKRVRINGD